MKIRKNPRRRDAKGSIVERAREMVRVVGLDCWTVAMQKWAIRPTHDKARLDLSRYREEFIEF